MSIGKVNFQAVNGRVVNIPQYAAAERNGDNFTSEYCRFRFAVTPYRGAKAAERGVFMDCIGWGMEARRLARTVSQGKQMTFFGHIDSSMLPVKDNEGNIVMQKSNGRNKDASGKAVPKGKPVAIITSSISFVIEDLVYGDDSADQKAKRPEGWDVEGHDGKALWDKSIAERKGTAFNPYPGGDTFGFAKVLPDKGHAVTWNAEKEEIPVPTGVAGVDFETNPTAAPSTSAKTNDADVALLAALYAQKWTDDQIRASGKYKHVAYLLAPVVDAPPADVDAPPPPATEAGTF